MRTLRSIVAILLILLSAHQSHATVPTRAEIYRWEIQQLNRPVFSQKFDNLASGNVELLDQQIDLELHPATTGVDVTTRVRLRAKTAIDQLYFFYEEPLIVSVEDENGTALSFQQYFDPGFLEVNLPRQFKAGEEFVLILAANGKMSCGGGSLVSVSCEFSEEYIWMLGLPFGLVPIDGRRHGSLEVRVTAPFGLRVVGAMQLVEEKPAGDDRTTWTFRSESPTATFGLAASTGFELHERTYGALTIRGWFSPQYRVQATTAMDHLQQMMPVFETWFGRFPWSSLTITEFGEVFRGAFAPQGTIFLSRYFLKHWKSISALGIQVLAHELAHQWWGNQSAIFHNRDVLLQEGIAEWASAYYYEKTFGSDENFKQNGLLYLYSVDDKEDSPVSPFQYQSAANLFAIVYAKGSVVLNMLRHKLGEQLFLAGLKRFLEEQREQYIDTATFKQTLESVSGVDLSEFFTQWVHRAGVPELTFRVRLPDDLDSPLSSILQVDQQAPAYAFPLVVELSGTNNTVPLTLPLETLRNEHPGPPPAELWRTSVPQTSPWLMRTHAANGDLNLDGIVDGRDLLELALVYGRRPYRTDLELQRREYDPGWNMLWDLNKNGVVDLSDRLLILTYFGEISGY